MSNPAIEMLEAQLTELDEERQEVVLALAELDEKRRGILVALAALRGEPLPDATAPAVTTVVRRPARAVDLIVELLAESPEGLTRGELAAAMDAKPDSVSGLLHYLRNNGRVRQLGGNRWGLAAAE